MEIEQLEKQIQIWTHFLYVILGSSITFILVSFGNLVYGTDWPGFGNYVGGIWATIQLLATLPAFYLWLAKRWKASPFSNRLNTIFGYLVVSWLNLLSLGLIASMAPPTDYYFLVVGSGIVIIVGYVWARNRISLPKEEIFP